MQLLHQTTIEYGLKALNYLKSTLNKDDLSP